MLTSGLIALGAYWVAASRRKSSTSAPIAAVGSITYELLGEHERAERYFRIALAQVEAELKRNAELPELWIALGEARAWLGDNDGAQH